MALPKDLLSTFDSFDREIKDSVTRDLTPKRKKEIADKLDIEYHKWNKLYLSKSREQAGLTRRINNALDKGSLPYNEIQKISDERSKLIAQKNALRETRETVKKKARSILVNKDVKVSAYKTVTVPKEKLLADGRPGLGVLRQQIRYINNDIKKIKSVEDPLDVLAGSNKLIALEKIRQKYIINLQMYMHEKEFDEVIEEDPELYEELLEYLADKQIDKYLLQWYATPNEIIIQ